MKGEGGTILKLRPIVFFWVVPDRRRHVMITKEGSWNVNG